MTFETAREETDETAAPETAGHLMTPNVPFAKPGETVSTLLEKIASNTLELTDPILAVDEHGRYLGAIRLDALVSARPLREAQALADPDWPCVSETTDQEHVAELARTKNLIGVPVIDEDRHALGCISTVRLLDVLWHEHSEDLHRLAGIMKPIHAADHALDDPPLMRARRRLPWLLVGLAGTAVATGVMATFEAMFAGNVRLAFFVPAIVYLADAIGAQTVTVAVRGLSIAPRPFWPLISGETITGVVIGLVLALLASLAVFGVYWDWRLATVVGVAILAAGAMASMIGLTLPWVLARMGLDPAFGSGPVATIIQDVLSILIYVLAAVAILPAA